MVGESISSRKSNTEDLLIAMCRLFSISKSGK